MELVTGPFHPDLENAFVETLRAHKKKDPLAPLAVVAPSQRLAGRLKELALDAFPKGVVGLHFYNLYSFAKDLLDRSNISCTLMDDPLVAQKLVREILETHFSDTPYLSRGVRSPGTSRALLGVIHDLKDACVDPDVALKFFVEELRRELEDPGPSLTTLAEFESPRLAEVFALYKHFQVELDKRNRTDRHDVARIVAETDFPVPFSHVIYYGFYELVQAQLDLLRAVVEKAPTTVLYPYVDAPPYRFARRFHDDILKPLARNTRIVGNLPAEPVLHAYTASGVHDEVWIAAKEILQWRDQGIRRIGLVARTLDPYLDSIGTIFSAHSIPFRSSAERTLLHEPYLRAARQLVRLSDRDWSREDVIEFLSSPCVRKAPGADVATWDLVTRAEGVGHGENEWRKRILPLRGKPRELELERRRVKIDLQQIDALCDAIERLFRAGSPPDGGTWADLLHWMKGSLHELMGEPPEELSRALAVLSDLDGVRPLPAAGELRETLIALLDEVKAPFGGDAGVQVLDAMAARGIPFDRLVVLGMNEKMFPRYILQDPFLRDDVRTRIEFRLGNRIPRKTDGYEEEKLLFTLLLTSAEETVLVRKRSDEKGKVQVPSMFLLPLALEPVEVPRQPARRLSMDVPLTPREASIREHFSPGAGERIRPLAGDRGWPLARLERASRFNDLIEARGRASRFDGHTGSMKEFFGAISKRGISPTSLERLAQCPFQYFAKYVLGLAPLEEPESEESLDPLEAGSMYHRALYLHLKDSIPIGDALDLAWGELEAKRTIRFPVHAGVVRERMRASLEAYLEKDREERGEFVPTHFEYKLEGEIAGQRFLGIADRVDLLADGIAFRVLDYKMKKSSRYSSKMETGVFQKGTYLQPPIYHFLVAQKYPDADEGASSSAYGFIEGTPSVKSLEGAFPSRTAEFEGILKGYLDRIREGRFSIQPGTHCDFCSFGAICRKSHMPTRLRIEREEKRDS